MQSCILICDVRSRSNGEDSITARKRSLRQGNVFTRICHSVHARPLPATHAPCHARPLLCMPPSPAMHAPRSRHAPTPPPQHGQ